MVSSRSSVSGSSAGSGAVLDAEGQSRIFDVDNGAALVSYRFTCADNLNYLIPSWKPPTDVEYRDADGKFTLKLVWPGQGLDEQTWRQKSNPVP